MRWLIWQSQLRFLFKADSIFCKLHKVWVPLSFWLLLSSCFSTSTSSIIFAIELKVFLLFLSLSVPFNFKYFIVIYTELRKKFQSLISYLGRPPRSPSCNNFSSFEVESRGILRATISRPELLLDFFSAIPLFDLMCLHFKDVSTTG